MARLDPLPYVRPAQQRNLRLSDLYLRQGEAEAESERRRGDISAQLWGNIGQTVGQTAQTVVQNREKDRVRKIEETDAAQVRESRAIALGEQRRQVNDRENFDLAMGAGSRERTLNALKDRPELYQKAQAHFETIDTTRKKMMGDVAAGVADFGYTPEAAMAALDDLIEQGFDEKRLDGLRGQITQNPSSVKQIVDNLLSQSPDPRHQAMAKPQPLVEVSDNARLYDPNTQTTLVESAPKPEPRAPNPTEASLAAAAAAGNPEAVKALELLRGQRPASAPAGPRPLTQTAETQLINRLVNQWTATTKPQKELKRQIEIMDAGLNAARKGNRAQGNEAVLQTFLKVLDPNSVVREGEFWRLQQGQSVLNRAKSAVQRLTEGGWVPNEELERYAALAKEIVQGLDSHTVGTRSRIQKNADRYGIPHELIFDDTATASSDTAQPGDIEYDLSGKPIKKGKP